MLLNTKGPIGIFGISGSGKTFGAVTHFYDNPQRSIFINTMMKRPPDVPFTGPYLSGKNPKLLDEITEYLNKPPYKVIIDTDDEAVVTKILDYFEKFYNPAFQRN